MSKETEQLIDAFGDAVSEHGWPAHWHPQKAFDRRATLLAYIKDIERERDEAREILAHTDIGSLPNDWTLKQVAEARIDDLMKLRDQVRDTCARAEKAEAENARLLDSFRGDPPTPSQWENICKMAQLLRDRRRLIDAARKP